MRPLRIQGALAATAVIAAVAAGLLLVAAPASAHAVCDQASPSDGSTVERAPSEVSCIFTEPLLPDSIMEIYDACNRRADDGNVVVAGYRMSVGMTATAPGVYRMRWLTHSAQDGHYAGPGTVQFTVRGNAAPCPSASPSPRPSASSRPSASAAPAPDPTTASASPSAGSGGGPSAQPSPSKTPSASTPAVGSTAGAIPPPVSGEERGVRIIIPAFAAPVEWIALILLIVVPLGLVPSFLMKRPPRGGGA